MYVCLCNPFTDKDVAKHLDQNIGKARVKDVYAACSGGENMNCGTCACTLKDIVDTHNNTITICDISDNMTKAAMTQKEPV